MANIVGAEWIDNKHGLIFFERNLSPKELAEFDGALVVNGMPQEVDFSWASQVTCSLANVFFKKGSSIVFVLHENWVPKHISLKEKFYLAGENNQWLSGGFDPKWELKSEIIENKSYMALKIPQDELPPKFQFKFVTACWEWLPVSEFCKNKTTNSQNIENFIYDVTRIERHILQFTSGTGNVRLSDVTCLKVADRVIPVDISRRLSFLYSDAKLGAWVHNGRTFFSIFVPRASNVEVFWKEKMEHEWKIAPMELKQNGVWNLEVCKNLTHFYYMFSICNGDGIAEMALDPYAQAAASRAGPGIILPEKMIMERCEFRVPERENLIIYECHVRDLLAHFPGLEESQKFGFIGLKSFIEQGYFQNLGVNAVELQPIQEFDNARKEDYHWGYMPVNYFSPASAYATDPQNASQVEEFLDLVRTFHQHKLAVILDVVYNHVGEPNHLYKIDNRYYFRENADGTLSNCSGCGNDLKTENPMVQKLILDSLEHWVRFYDVDGFRFDLAELVGLPFLEKIQAHLRKIKPGILIIAEPWSFRRYVGHDLKPFDFHGWNDEFRNFVRIYVQGTGNVEGIKYFLRGSLDFRSRFPSQSVNYLSSHDDHCWIDAITENAHHERQVPTWTDLRRTHLALAILFLSLGIPMLAEGTELLHSKQGVSNTYQRGDLNALYYDRALEYPLTPKYIQELIKLRLDSGLFCLSKPPAPNYIEFFASQENNSAIAVLFNANDCSKNILLAINPHFQKTHFKVKTEGRGEFQQIADTLSFEKSIMAQYHWDGNFLEMPPLSCGIWKNY